MSFYPNLYISKKVIRTYQLHIVNSPNLLVLIECYALEICRFSAWAANGLLALKHCRYISKAATC